MKRPLRHCKVLDENDSSSGPHNGRQVRPNGALHACTCVRCSPFWIWAILFTSIAENWSYQFLVFCNQWKLWRAEIPTFWSTWNYEPKIRSSNPMFSVSTKTMVSIRLLVILSKQNNSMVWKTNKIRHLPCSFSRVWYACHADTWLSRVRDGATLGNDYYHTAREKRTGWQQLQWITIGEC